MLHPYILPYYEHIKNLRKLLVNAGAEGKMYIQGTVFDFPPVLFAPFTHFLHPETGAKLKGSELLQARIGDSKLYAQIFHAADFRVATVNSYGHVLKMSKQMVMPSGVEDYEEGKEETKEQYEAFFKQDKESLQIDFANQAVLSKRQGKLLETTQTKPVEYRPFDLIKKMGLWVILLCHGGSFSIGIFNGKQLIAHKSDKKYLIRKKAGGRQSNKDKSKSVMRSVGSQMRREMEKVHQENVANIMEDCKKYLSEALVIFLHAPGINRSFFLSEGMPLKPYMGKIRPVILNTKKANFTSVMEVFEKLTAVNLSFSPVPPS